MSITFKCQNCQATMTVQDQMAGKRGKCSKCKGVVTVPASVNGEHVSPPVAQSAPAAKTSPPALPAGIKNRSESRPPAGNKTPSPPPPPDEDVEAAAAALLGDAPREEEKVLEFIEFNCPQCDEPVKLSLEHAGKKHPCPECRRIISVPLPKKKDPANWRDTGPSLPSAARRDVGPALEDAWGTDAKKGASHEALKEAGVIQDTHKPATLLQRLWPYLVLGSPVLLLLVSGLWLWHWWAQMTEKSALDAALAMTNSNKAPQLIGNGGLAVIHANAARYYLNTEATGCASKAHQEFSKAIARARQSGGEERDALLIEMLPMQMELAGDRDQRDSDVRKTPAEVQKLLNGTLMSINNPRARLEGIRRVAAEYITRKDEGRIIPLTLQVYAGADSDRCEALAAVALVLLKAGHKELASDAAKQALAPFAGKDKKGRPELRASVVAAAVLFDQEPPKALNRLEEIAADLIGRAAGLARKGEVEKARELLSRRLDDDIRFLILLEIAEATGESADATAALDALTRVTNRSPLGWASLRLLMLGQRAGLSAEQIEVAAKAVPAQLAPWSHLVLLRNKLASGAVEVAALEQFPTQSLAARVARLELAQHNTRRNNAWANTVRGWDEGPRALGSMGVALGLQGK